MKRLFLVLSIIILAFGLILMSCSSQTSATPPNQSPGPPQKSSTAASSSAIPAQSSASSIATAPGTIQMKFSYWAPTTAPQPKAVQIPWSEAVTAATKGRVQIAQYGGETLVKQEDHYDSIANGLCDIGMVATESTPGRFPLSAIQTLPGLLPNSVIGAEVFYDLAQKYIVNTEMKDVKVLFTTGYEPSELFSNVQAKTPDQMKGLKIRTEGRVEQWTMEQLGATGIELSMTDTYNGLDRKLVDGCNLQWAGATTFKIQNVAKYCTQNDLFSRQYFIAMNLKVWNSLPADIQKAITDCSSIQAVKSYNTAFMNATKGARGAIAAYYKQVGNQDIYVPTTEEKAAWQTAVKPVWDKWVADTNSKGLPGKAMLDDALALVQKYSQAQ